MTDFKPTNQFQRETVKDLLSVLKRIVATNTDDSGIVNIEQVGKEVLWLVKADE